MWWTCLHREVSFCPHGANTVSLWQSVAAATLSPILALKSLMYKMPLRRGACLFEVASLWNALKESLVPVRKAELKSWKEFGSFLMVFLQHSGARSAYLPGIAWHTHRDRHRAAALRNTFSVVCSFLDVYACMWAVEMEESFSLLLIVSQWWNDGGRNLSLKPKYKHLADL